MTKVQLLIVSLLLMSCVGCQTLETLQSDPAAELHAAQISFKGTIRALIELRDAGLFDDGELERISGLIYSCQALLEQWERALFEEPPKAELRYFNESFARIIGELIAYSRR